MFLNTSCVGMKSTGRACCVVIDYQWHNMPFLKDRNHELLILKCSVSVLMRKTSFTRAEEIL